MTAPPHASIAAVSPHDCALCIAVPLTRDDFFDDLAAPEGKDFVQHVRRVNSVPGAADQFYWSSVYAPIAATVERACVTAARLGVDVRQRITLADLPPLFERKKVLTLVAHWKFARVTASDIVDPRHILASIVRPANPLQARVAGAILDRSPQLAADSAAATDDVLRERIAAA